MAVPTGTRLPPVPRRNEREAASPTPERSGEPGPDAVVASIEEEEEEEEDADAIEPPPSPPANKGLRDPGAGPIDAVPDVAENEDVAPGLRAAATAPGARDAGDDMDTDVVGRDPGMGPA